MKYLLALPVLFFCLAFDLREKSPESVPAYAVTAVNSAPSLPAGTASVLFTFQNAGLPVRDTLIMSCNGKETKFAPDQNGKFTYQSSSGKAQFQFYYNADYTEIYTDSILLKDRHRTEITVNFTNSRVPVICEKPVIYVYPETTMQVNIQLNVNGKLGFTYPQYNSGWNFTAEPNGTLTMNGRKYDYLFWDGESDYSADAGVRSTGFIVDRDSLPAFFEQQLSAMGLNAREQEDFITYWCPRMQQNEKSFVHFMFTSEYDSIATMNISPKPDHVFRVFMLWSDASGMEASSVHEQEIESFDRSGFTVVEWGGGEISETLQ